VATEVVAIRIGPLNGPFRGMPMGTARNIIDSESLRNVTNTQFMSA